MKITLESIEHETMIITPRNTGQLLRRVRLFIMQLKTPTQIVETFLRLDFGLNASIFLKCCVDKSYNCCGGCQMTVYSQISDDDLSCNFVCVLAIRFVLRNPSKPIADVLKARKHFCGNLNAMLQFKSVLMIMNLKSVQMNVYSHDVDDLY